MIKNIRKSSSIITYLLLQTGIKKRNIFKLQTETITAVLFTVYLFSINSAISSVFHFEMDIFMS